ncbi:hypothetical protein [Tateyamaria sp. Alg231-49]|uniref:hypothetical protein n=1 Tax=Tateyamaria sp. Alg231-49 TaxID=1922219 RepID=UPI000D55698F|nr:hypothetical protein [Tateyamaria sp. Alg231-49]
MGNYPETTQAVLPGTKQMFVLEMLHGEGTTKQQIADVLKISAHKGAYPLIQDLRHEGYTINKYTNEGGVAVFYTNQQPA